MLRSNSWSGTEGLASGSPASCASSDGVLAAASPKLGGALPSGSLPFIRNGKCSRPARQKAAKSIQIGGEPFYLFFEQGGDLLLREIDSPDFDAQLGGDFLDRTLPDGAKVEHLVLLGADPLLDVFGRHREQILFPFFVPNRLQAKAGWIWHALDHGGARCVFQASGTGVEARCAVAEL